MNAREPQRLSSAELALRPAATWVNSPAVTDASDLIPRVIDLMNRNALRVPPYPAVAVRLRRVIARGDYGLGELERIVGEDQTLAATLLRYANSAVYRRVTATTTLGAAIMRIGASEVARIALALSVGGFAVENGPLGAIRHGAWRQALVSALCCRALAYWRQTDAEEAYVCGLLHDFGRVVAASGFEDVLARLHDTRVLSEATWNAAVEEVHIKLGLLTAQRWNLSPLLCSVIANHHAPERAGGHRSMVEIVAVADRLGEALDREPHPTTSVLMKAAPLRADEAEYMVTILSTVAASVSAIDETTASPDAEPAPPITSQVARPPSALAPPHKAVELNVSLLRSAGNLPCRGTYLSRDGIAFVGKIKIRENSMIRFRVETPKQPLDVWAVVARCEPDGDSSRIEARLFAVAPELQAAWARLFASFG
jgi:HD-like signal output (HDOD) protein